MFKRVNTIWILLLIFLFNNVAIAENKISFIDVEYIFSNSSAGKIINKQIQKESKSIKSDLDSNKKKFNDENKNLINQKNILAKDEYEKKNISLQNKIKVFNKKINIKNNDLLKYKNKAKNEFSKELQLILSEYADENSIEIILNKSNILIGQKNLDITKNILGLLDKKIKKFNLK